MKSPVNIAELETTQAVATPIILDSLPNLPIPETGCPRRARIDIDLMLLAIEALQVGASEQVLKLVQELELQPIIPNRVALWRMRNTNPLRLYPQRRPLTLEEAKALVIIIANMARKLTVTIRKLLLDYQVWQQRQLPIETHVQVSGYVERFGIYLYTRTNPRRIVLLGYDDDDKLNELALETLSKLLFCTGTAGMQRFWVSLFDGELQ